MTDKELCRTLWATYWAAPTRKVTGLAELHAEFHRRFGRPHTLADGEVPPARFGEDLDD